MRRPILICSLAGSITVILIILFLNGKIVDIKQGTHEGGVTGAIVVVAILAVMFALTFLIAIIDKKRLKSKRSEP